MKKKILILQISKRHFKSVESDDVNGINDIFVTNLKYNVYVKNIYYKI